MKTPILCAIDNRSIPGFDHCFGAPFVARDIEAAKDMVSAAIEKDADKLDLTKFFLVELCSYDMSSDFPLPLNAITLHLAICVNDFYVAEETAEEVKDEVQETL